MPDPQQQNIDLAGEREVLPSNRISFHLRSSRRARWSLRLIAFLTFIALFSDFIANERPLYCRIEGKTYFPVIRQYAVDAGFASWEPRFLRTAWRDQDYEQVIFPLIPYSANTVDIDNLNFKSPFEDQRLRSGRFRHFLGTDSVGRDVAAGLIGGVRTSLLVGLLAMSIASLIGLLFGALAGYFGDEGLKWSAARLVLNPLGFVVGLWVAFGARAWSLTFGESPVWEMGKSFLLFLCVMTFVNLLASLLDRFSIFRSRHRLPVDLFVMRLIELFHSVPLLLIILALLAIIRKPSLWHVITIIGLVSWTGIARFTRAEFLRIRNLEYVEAARALGFSDWRIIWNHIFPNAITPLLIVFSFGIAGAILAEATLSFLGIGNPDNVITWGAMLRQARSNIQAWWLALFPGFALFVTIAVFNIFGESLSQAMGGKG
jgi:peptide/nickel transport system permease protein